MAFRILREGKKEWYSEDMTFCMNYGCMDRKCYRNPNNIEYKDIPHSFSMMKDTEYCPQYN